MPGSAIVLEPSLLSDHALHELFTKLKNHDPQWLAQTLQERWMQIGRGEARSEVSDDEGMMSSKRADPTDPTCRGGPAKRARADNETAKGLWPFDITAKDWTCARPLTAHLQALRDHDWASSALGPMSLWSQELRYFLNLVITDPRPAALWWGEQRTLIYNEGYAMILGARHPLAMGRTFDSVWPELVSNFAHPFNLGYREGIASSGDHALFMTNRNGFREELWASWSIIPVPAENGKVGFYNPVLETTSQALTDRRLSTLLRLSQSLTAATGISEFWNLVVSGLEPNQHDIPFAAFYATTNSLLDDQQQDGSMSTLMAKQWILQDTIGLPANIDGLPARIDTQSPPHNFVPNFANTIAKGQPTLLTTATGSFPKSLRGIARSHAFDEACSAAVFCPIGPTRRENVLGFILLGVNPCHQYDTDYEQFVELLVRQLSTSLASLVLTEEERRRSREDHLRLSEQLAVTQQIAVDNEHRFQSMADLAPVAMFHCSSDGRIIYANAAWFELTGHPRDGFTARSWLQTVHEDDVEIVQQEWAKLMAGEPSQFETRLKKPFETKDYMEGQPVQGTTWIIASAYADKHPNGSVRGVLGCLLDISRQKWIESLQERRVEEAVELRRQQENFMDMTSHEARNPLSAMTLCAESMLVTFKDILEGEEDPLLVSRDTIQTHLDGADIIMACAQHQKRIIDDVLTLSKLDSKLLIIAPIEVQPDEVVRQALRMLDSEFQRGDIAIDLTISEGYRNLQVNWVRLDPSRILQVLINLLANAVKFTQHRKQRHIHVTLDASTHRPVSSTHGIRYLGQTPLPSQLTPAGKDDLYISVVVRDTGTGIPSQELTSLFQRFQQANPKTHVEYGGSGLGLFVSRELVKLQGGDIGVSSEVNAGSSFAFFVRTSRCSGPLVLPKKFSPAGLHDSAPAVLDAERNVLLVEDNLVNQRVMKMQLMRAGYTVVVANHGQEALGHVRQSRFCAPGLGLPLDIVLLDVEMPVMDGLTCVRHIREMEKTGEAAAHVPIIAVTANARAEQQAMALQAGMDSVICKPFRLSELTEMIERVRNMHATTNT